MDEILNYIVFLENALAGFYNHIKGLPRLQRFTSILEFMETHSLEHSDFIKETGEKFKRPVMDNKLIADVHNGLTRDLLNKIKEENSNDEIMKMLADAEESIGILYEKIAAHSHELSDYYKNLSDAVSKIAKDEYNHRDLLLNDRKKLLEKNKKTSS